LLHDLSPHDDDDLRRMDLYPLIHPVVSVLLVTVVRVLVHVVIRLYT
jgi:hypothetical protein